MTPTPNPLARLIQEMRDHVDREKLRCQRGVSTWQLDQVEKWADALTAFATPPAKQCAMCDKPQPCPEHGRTPVTDEDYQELHRDVSGQWMHEGLSHTTDATLTPDAFVSPPLKMCCGEPAPDGSSRQCDKPKGHSGNHWTYGGNTLTWAASRPDPLAASPPRARMEKLDYRELEAKLREWGAWRQHPHKEAVWNAAADAIASLREQRDDAVQLARDRMKAVRLQRTRAERLEQERDEARQDRDHWAEENYKHIHELARMEREVAATEARVRAETWRRAAHEARVFAELFQSTNVTPIAIEALRGVADTWESRASKAAPPAPAVCPRCLGDGMETDDEGIIRDGDCRDCAGTGKPPAPEGAQES